MKVIDTPQTGTLSQEANCTITWTLNTYPIQNSWFVSYIISIGLHTRTCIQKRKLENKPASIKNQINTYI